MVRTPPPLRPGSVVAIVAPAGPFDREEFFRGLAWLRTRYVVRMTGDILSRTGYLAGTDERRAAELASAMTDPAVEAIVCARGGYGSMRILDRLPWVDFAKQPKWIVGFSDITALHVAATAEGVASIHGPNVTGLGRSIDASERLALIDALEGRQPAPWNDLQQLFPTVSSTQETVEGVLAGGNLAIVHAMAAAGRLRLPPSCVLVLEDVGERPYRIDRMLTSLVLGGHLSQAAAIVFGGFSSCDPGVDGVVVEDVLRETTKALGIPVLVDAPFGHGSPNLAFVLGSRVTIRSGALHFRPV